MRKVKYLRAVVAAILIATMLCGGAMAASRSAKVTSPSMSVYKTKSTRRKIATLPHGATFKVTGISGNWAKITYKGKSGYAKLNNIMFTRRMKVVSTEKTPIKFMTKSSYRKHIYYTGTLAPGVTLYVTGIKGRYYLFVNENGSTMGYVKRSAVRKAA